MTDTSISWTNKTWNPVQGCARVSEGCRNCYAERLAARFAESGWSQGLINLRTRKWSGEARLAAHKLTEPLTWRKPTKVFVNSMSDLFYERFTNEEIAAVFGIMAACPQHTFQILTKRPERMREWFAWIEEQREVDGDPWVTILREATCSVGGDSTWDRHARENLVHHGSFDVPHPWPLPSVWLGTSVENQDAANERIPALLQTPAAVRFLSCEPLIGPLDLRGKDNGTSWSGGDWIRTWTSCREDDDGVRTILESRPRIDWVISGCESGPGARRCEVEWLRSLRDQCAAAGVPYFLKQAVQQMVDVKDVVRDGTGSRCKAGSVIELPYLDGVQHAAFPEVRT